jgi:hypothetical protein
MQTWEVKALFTGVVFLLIGLALVGYTLLDYNYLNRMHRDGVTTNARIINREEIQKYDEDGEQMMRITFAYTVDGGDYEGQVDLSRVSAEAETVEVVYLPNDPTDYQLADEVEPAYIMILVGVGALLFSASMFYLWRQG